MNPNTPMTRQHRAELSDFVSLMRHFAAEEAADPQRKVAFEQHARRLERWAGMQ